MPGVDCKTMQPTSCLSVWFCVVCVSHATRETESPDRQRANLADRRGILKRFFLRKELSGGAVGERPYYLKPKQGGPVCCADQSTDTTVAGGYHNTQRAVWPEPVICIFRDLLKLWQKWQSHFLFKIAYPHLLYIYMFVTNTQTIRPSSS